MNRFVYLAILLVACVSGCAQEYAPPPETIPDIPPSTRGGGGRTPDAAGKTDASKAAPAKKGGAGAP